MTSKDERMIIRCCNRTPTRCTYMRKTDGAARVRTQVPKVEIVDRWVSALVGRRPQPLDIIDEFLLRVRVPGNAHAVHVEEAVAHGDGLVSGFARVVRVVWD